MNKYEKQVEQLQLNKEKQVLKDLKTMYRKALDGVNEMIVMLMSDPTSKSKAYQAKFQAVLKRQIETLLDVLQNKEFDTINEFLKESYDNGYIGTMYVIKEQGIPLMLPISQAQVIKAIQLDSKISKGLYERLGEDVKELKKKIRSEVSRGISTSMNYTDISRNIDNVSNVGINNAMRIARTESHRIKSAASYDAALEAKKKGADIVLQWDATLDGKTRQRHKRLDGEIRELGETFSNGLRYPGDENGAAAEVINCRCVALTRARWGLDEDELKELERRAEYFELDKTKDFEEYKRKYLKITPEAAEKADEAIENIKENAIIELQNTSNCHYATKEQYAAEKKSCKKNVTKEDAVQAMKHEKADGSPGGYVATNNYSNINSNLRGDGFTLNKLDDDDIKTIESLRRAIQTNTLDDDYILTRYVNANYLTSVFGIKGRYNSGKDFSTLTNSITQVANPYVVNTEIPRITGELKQWIGKTIEPDKAFVSTSMLKDKNIMKDKPVLFNIKAPKGTHAYFPENRKESECILAENTVFAVENVEYSTIARKWVFDVVVIE